MNLSLACRSFSCWVPCELTPPPEPSRQSAFAAGEKLRKLLRASPAPHGIYEGWNRLEPMLFQALPNSIPQMDRLWQLILRRSASADPLVPSVVPVEAAAWQSAAPLFDFPINFNARCPWQIGAGFSHTAAGSNWSHSAHFPVFFLPSYFNLFSPSSAIRSAGS